MRKREWAAHKEALRELRLRHEDEYHQILAKKLAAPPPPRYLDPYTGKWVDNPTRWQGENQMETVMPDTTFDVRLAALDRAIDFLQHSHRTEAADAEEVVAWAARFERYLTRTNG
jgi:hypothetical protein